jgi:hypothetical protein
LRPAKEVAEKVNQTTIQLPLAEAALILLDKLPLLFPQIAFVISP